MSVLGCQYVGSRALLLLADHREPTIVSDSGIFTPVVYLNNHRENELFHVCPQALFRFVKEIVPYLKKPFRLLTNNSDWTIPDDIQEEFDSLVNHPLLVHWFAQNCVVTHPKVTRIPIGLDYHSLTPELVKQFSWSSPKPTTDKHLFGWGTKLPPIQQEGQLLFFQKHAPPFWARKVQAYANFHFLMTTRYGKIDRIDAFNTVSKDLVYYEPIKCERVDCWRHMVQYAFVVSPQGNGLDCHRTWEALCLGCIPIVKTSGLDPLFENLPVWIVSRWSDVTHESMKSKIEEFRTKSFHLEKLTLSYWADYIKHKS